MLVGGHPWGEAPDVEGESQVQRSNEHPSVKCSKSPLFEPPEEHEALDLESLLDDAIVEATRRRRTFPKQILPHVIHSLKAERKLMVSFSHFVFIISQTDLQFDNDSV